MYFDEFKHQLPDIDPDETQDWMESLDQVVEQSGETRARFLVYKLLKRARQLQIGLPPLTQTRYINTISPEQEPAFPGDEAMERRIRRLIRWNAAAMVLRAPTIDTSRSKCTKPSRMSGTPPSAANAGHSSSSPVGTRSTDPNRLGSLSARRVPSSVSSSR